MKILVNCYACSPYKGSEPGMGWNFVKCLSKNNELHIITESKFKKDIDKYFFENPEEHTYYHFYFIRKNRHKKLRKIWPPSYYWFYNEWQRKALRLAKTLDEKEHFDLVHQLNMVGYREPGYLIKLNKPFVWGPIGGFNITPWRLLPSMGVYGCIYYTFRNLVNLYQMHYSTRAKRTALYSDAILCATRDDVIAVKKLWNKSSTLIEEVGYTPINTEPKILPRVGRLKLCWSGLHIPRKSLNLLLEAMAQCKSREEIELHVIGDGKCSQKWKNLSRKLNLNNITWYGWVKKDTALNIMGQSHLFIITSLSDATSTVLMEALSLGLPVIALNHLGFANVVTEECGIKVDIHSKKQVIEDLSVAIDKICSSESFRLKLAQKARERAKDFTWGKKAKTINKIYEQVTTKS